MIKSLNDIKAYSLLRKRESPFLEQIHRVYDYATNFLPKCNRVFGNYTGHEILHSLNVTDYMLAICDSPEYLSDLELTVLIFVALLHDTGMGVSEDEIKRIKNDDSEITPRRYSLVLEKYGDETIALQECIRPIHGQRSYYHVMNMDQHLFILPGYTNISMQEDVARICAAHNENFDWISQNLLYDQQKGSWHLNSQYLAILLRIADYLDIDEERAPYYLYQYLSPKDYGDMEWRQHFVIENRDKVVIDEKTGRKSIEFYGESSNPNIHRKLLKYFDAINDELKRATNYAETFRDEIYLLSIRPAVRNKIRTKGFSFSDFKLSLDYKAVTSLLMGENIYGDKKYGLRELIQNSIDACMVMREEALKSDNFKYSPYHPFIRIILDQDGQQVIVFDNGRGMSIQILKDYFLNVGVSYYASDDYRFMGNSYVPIGNYGIGFLACFMLSDKVSVITKFHGETQINKIDFEKNSEFICLTCEESPHPQGTEIILDYDQFMSVFDHNIALVENFITRNFIDSPIPIFLVESKAGKSSEKVIKLRSFKEICPEGNNLSSYFDGIDVIANFSYKGISFWETFSDLPCGKSLLYSEIENVLMQENSSIELPLLKSYIKDGRIKYLRVPIITADEEYNFVRAFEVLEDFDDALRKVNYEDAIIVADDTALYSDSELLESSNDKVIGGCTLEDFSLVTGHDSAVPTCTYLTEKLVIEGSGTKVLAYETKQGFHERFWFEHSDHLYIKNVLISNAQIKIPFLAEGIELKGLAINAMGKHLVPNVSRNNINDEQHEQLSYAIGKALHMWIYEHGEFAPDEKELLRIFIQKCYSKANIYLKECNL